MYPSILTHQSYVAFALAIGINALALVLIATRSPPTLGKYRLILCNFSINDLIFAGIMVLNPMQALLSGSMTLYVDWGPIAQLPSSMRSIVAIIVFGISLSFFVYSIALITIAFVYRYIILCRTFRPTNVQLQLIIIAVFIATLIIPITFSLSTIPVNQLVDRFNSAIENRSSSTMLFNASEIANVSVIFGTDFDINPLALIPMALTLLSFVPAYITIVWCFMKIYRYLKERRSSMSSTTLQMQKNLLLALSMQSLLPSICVITPGVNYIAYMLNSGNNSPVFEFISFIVPEWLPVINPLLTILSIPPYRRALIAPFCRNSSPPQNEILFHKVEHKKETTIR